MSFSRQLVIMMFALVLCAFSVRSVMTVHEMRGYLSQQLRSHARDAARSLGLSASLHMAQGDTLFVESIVDSMFDSGDYASIRVDDLDGKAMLVRERVDRPAKCAGVVRASCTDRGARIGRRNHLRMAARRARDCAQSPGLCL